MGGMDERDFLASLPPAAGGFAASRPPAEPPPAHWLADTPLLQHEHPKVRLTAKKLTQLKATPREQALACFQFVRALPFACVPDGVTTTGPQVLRAGRGDCHTKATLMVALLRSLGIPARMRFVTLPPDFLHGVADLGDRTIEHACTEVRLDGRWLATDAYVADPRLAVAARDRLRREGRRLGYGVHVAGTLHWDGRDDAFGQFAPDEAEGRPVLDWGVYDDPYQFYSSVAYVRGRLSLSGRLLWRVGAGRVNRRVQELRGGPAKPG